MNLQELREAITKNLDAMEALVKAAGASPLSDDQQKLFDDHKAKADVLQRQLEQANAIAVRRAAVAQQIQTPTSTPAVPRSDEPIKNGVALTIRYLIRGAGNPQQSIGLAVADLGEQHPIVRAMQAGVLGSGGFVVPQQYSSEVIELLRPVAIVRRSAGAIIPMPNGSYTLPRVAAGSTASYIGEGSDIAVSQPSGDQVKLQARKLVALVPVSNDLRRFASPATDQMVTNDVAMSLGVAEDSAFIRGTGTGGTPQGLRYQCLAANVFAANGTVNATNVKADLNSAIYKLQAANSRLIKPRWSMNPRVWNFLCSLTENGIYTFPETKDGNLRGFPVDWTTNIPANLGGGGNESEVYLTDYADVVIGEANGIEITISTEGAYVTGGTTTSAFQRDETLIRAVANHDVALRHRGNCAVITTVTWA